MRLKYFLILALFLTGLMLAGCQTGPVGEGPPKVLKEYLNAWIWADTPKMYQLLTRDERVLIPFEEYDRNFEDFPLRPYQYKILGASGFGKTVKIKVELLMPAMTAEPQKNVNPDVPEVSRNVITFVLKNEGGIWKISEKETFKK